MSLVALIDGPLPADHGALAGRIALTSETEDGSPAAAHAMAVAEAILGLGPDDLRFVSIAVFGDRLATDAATLARALAAAADSNAWIVHCSLGIARNDPAVAAAVDRLTGDGRLVVAASPARGDPVWPAAMPGVIAVQGDARCAADQWSLLDPSGPLFGACPCLASDRSVAGASIAAAHLTGHLTAIGIDALHGCAAFHGPERRTG